MTNQQRDDRVTRHHLLALLSDDEIASVTAAEADTQLATGQEYLDLTNLEEGVQVSREGENDVGNVVPRSAVAEATWQKLVAQLPFAKAN